MAIETDTVANPGLTTEKPVTNVTKTKKATRAEKDFNVAIGIIAVSWVTVIFLTFSLRKYNI